MRVWVGVRAWVPGDGFVGFRGWAWASSGITFNPSILLSRTERL